MKIILGCISRLIYKFPIHVIGLVDNERDHEKGI
jgi:hypothetical protein